MFYLIGLGLFDEKDITIRGLEIVKNATRVYLESYTSILMVDKERLEAFYGREVILADRDMVETASDEILSHASTSDVALLVVGDPFGATTHHDILLRARALNIPTDVVHNASIMNAIGACGLQLYSFGQAVSIPFWTDTWKPDSWLGRIQENVGLGLHTLVLLDIKVKEQSEEDLARGRKIFQPPRYMTPASTLSPTHTLALALSRVGTPTQSIRAGTLAQLATLPEDAFGPPLHSLVIVGSRVHPMEIEFTSKWAIDGDWLRVARDVYAVEIESE
ncbi:hypothetical protein BS47DRAFT_1377760 [Hydnum rufescens UP504]|uniref:diphthine methyl ester synthase n=1 Tax=Hydnum rufescens UP504 TaxID=1448309 RepID=A0A9P6AM36_9AGAM|nr:hypothetical protein BS47DRAFT_1377760 [Hydnum rufescens UP504]